MTLVSPQLASATVNTVDLLTAMSVLLAALVLLGDRLMKAINVTDGRAERHHVGPLGLIEIWLLAVTGAVLILNMIAVAFAGPNSLTVHGVWVAAALYGLSVFAAVNIRERVARWQRRHSALRLLYRRLDNNAASAFEDVIFCLRARDLIGASRAGRQVLQAWARSNGSLPEHETIEHLMFASPPPTRPENLLGVRSAVLAKVPADKLRELWSVSDEGAVSTYRERLYAYLRVLWCELVDKELLPPEL